MSGDNWSLAHNWSAHNWSLTIIAVIMKFYVNKKKISCIILAFFEIIRGYQIFEVSIIFIFIV